jgi:hypothetical protein
MQNGSTVECADAFDAQEVDLEPKTSKVLQRLRAMPWARIAVDTLLVAGILFASSSFLSVR